MIRYILLIGSAFLMAGCSTVVRGTKQGVRFESMPEGAYVTIVRAKKRKTQWNCITPCELQLSRKRDFDVTFTLDGYKPVKARLASRLGAKGGTAAVAGNFVAGGAIGFVVDAGTGANMQLKPDPMRATLAQIGSDEESVVYDIRIEGGGVQDVYTSDSDIEDVESLKKLRRITRDFGAEGSPVNADSAVATAMSDPYGVLLLEVNPKGAAARAGLKNGDVVQSIGSTRVTAMEEINEYIQAMQPGETVMVVIWRDQELYEAELTL